MPTCKNAASLTLLRLTQLWHLSRGLPLYLGILTSNPHGKVDPTANVVDNFLRWIPEQDKIKRRLALDASLFTMPFNKDDLSAFHYLEQERDALFSWLISQPFIRSNPQDGRYTYHEIAQELFSRYLYQRSPDECCETRRALVRHYQKRLEDTEKDGGDKVYASTRWQELALALAQQLFFLPDEGSHLKGLEQIFTAWYDAKNEQEGEIVRVLREICKEEKTFQINTSAHEIAHQLLAYIEAEIGSEEFLNAANYMLEKTIHIPSFPAKLLASIYKNKGENYRLRGELQHAIADFDHAIALDPNDAWAFAQRGVAYRLLEDYQHAIADFDRAIELNPNYDWTFAQRGEGYRLLENYQHALSDFDRAIVLNPNYAWAFSHRGETYRLLEDYQLALADFDRAIALNSNDSWTYGSRGQAYSSLKDYQYALSDFDHAIALNPNYAWAYFERGCVYLMLKDLQSARSDFEQSRSLDPTDVVDSWAIEFIDMCHKKPDMAVAEHLETIAEIDLQRCESHICKGVAQWIRGNFEQALAKLDQALSIDSESEDAFFWKGIVYASLKQDEAAIAAIEKALELELPPVLLAPLRWFEQDRPEFYAQHVIPLLAHFT